MTKPTMMTDSLHDWQPTEYLCINGGRLVMYPHTTIVHTHDCYHASAPRTATGIVNLLGEQVLSLWNGLTGQRARTIGFCEHCACKPVRTGLVA